MICVEAVNPLYERALIGGCADPIMDMDPLDHEDVAFELDLARSLALELPLAGIDLARLQRTCKRAGQSPAGRGDHVVERRGVRRKRIR